MIASLVHKFGQEGVIMTTYARGKRHIDFIFMDQKLLPAVQRVGTLGLHEAMFSDHVMVYMDLDEKILFNGIINRPVAVPSREFMLAQADKCEKFLKLFLEIVEKRRLTHEFISFVMNSNNMDPQSTSSMLTMNSTLKYKKSYWQQR
jgi:hypothetical protein